MLQLHTHPITLLDSKLLEDKTCLFFLMTETKCYNLFHLHDYRHYRAGWVNKANKVKSFLPSFNQMQHAGIFMIG